MKNCKNCGSKNCNCNCHHPLPEVSLHANVQRAIDAIKTHESGRCVQHCGPVTFVLCTDHAHLGSLLYTAFNTATGFPIESWQARFSRAHVVGQVLFTPVPKIKLPYLVDCCIPNYQYIVEIPPQVIPGAYHGEYHYVEPEQHHHHHHYHHSWLNPHKK